MRQRLPFNVFYWTGAQAQVATLRAGKHFRIDIDAINRFCLTDLPRRLLDFLRLASAVYVVDRLVKRRSRKPARKIGLKVEVFDREFWDSGGVRATIEETVNFLGGDFWDIEFLKDTGPYWRKLQLLPNHDARQSPLVALYSGGLDSAAGLAWRIANEPTRSIIPVSV